MASEKLEESKELKELEEAIASAWKAYEHATASAWNSFEAFTSAAKAFRRVYKREKKLGQ